MILRKKQKTGWKRHIYRDRNQISDCQNLGKGVDMDNKNRPKGNSGIIEIYILIVVMVTQLCLLKFIKLSTLKE